MRCAAVFFLFWTATAIVSPAQTHTTLHNFNFADGSNPHAGLVQASDGNFYGTAQSGGANNDGVVFKMTPQGVLTLLHSFSGTDGKTPVAVLVQATDGNFYGATPSGGANNGSGTVFKITPTGTLTKIHDFCSQQSCADGVRPLGGLVQATDGNFYGTTERGGPNALGSVFKVTPAGVLTTLHTFTFLDYLVDGDYPEAGLVLATDGNFYGTTYSGGANSYGTVFKITPDGTLTTLHSFQGYPTEGSNSQAVLVQGSDGNFYGTTLLGGANRYGTVFKITPSGTVSTLYSFCATGYPCPDGDKPTAGLVQCSDGNFYGTTLYGGAANGGTAFKITASGTLTTLYSFGTQLNNADGIFPEDGLVQAADGNFYGTASGGGISYGTVFRLDAGISGVLLSVSKDGSGLVSSADGHIYCGSTCLYSYFPGTKVTLSGVPSPGYTFTGWTGCDQTNGSYCSVTMTSAKDVTASFSTANITLTSLTFKPSYVRCGQLSAGTLTLSGPAPEGGVTVALSSDHPGVAHPPAFVFVPGGKSSVQFAVQTFPVKSNTTVTITATAGSSHVSGTLTVGTTSLPPSLR